MATNPEQYFRIKSIFERAIDIPSGSRRDAFLDEVCNDIDNIRSEVESLLREYESGHDFMETPAMGAGFAVNVDELHNDYSEEDAFNWLPDDRMIGGKYHVRSLLAFGGMGAVYEATQENPSRTVALKVMRRGFTGRSVRRRFEYECEALAKLQHPHIAHLYDCGIHYTESVRRGGEGISYFVMEYIDHAKSITEWARSNSLGTRDRLRLFSDVCEAIQHGHQRGVIHRDIKPGNILVGSDGEVKVIDFGVACMTNSDIAITTMHTDIGQLIGTVQYMSPEQCAGDVNDIDVRSDVYSLGLVLYELLTDELPYDVSGQSVVQAVKTVQEHSPKRLSTIHHSLRGDLETIVFKALAKEREARYQSVDEMVRDVAHYLHHEPIVARPASMIYRTAKFVERYRWQTATVSAFTLLVLIVVVAAVMGQLAMRAARNEALAVSIAQGAKQNSALAAILAADSAGAKQILNRIPAESRKWEWYHINSTIDQSAETIDPPENSPDKKYWDMDISDDGTLMVTVVAKSVIIWDLHTHTQILTIQQRDKAERFVHAAVSPDNKYAAIEFVTIKEEKNPYLHDAYVRLVRLKDKAIIAEKKLGNGDVKDVLFLHRESGPPVLAVSFDNQDMHLSVIVLLKLTREDENVPSGMVKPRLVEIAELKGHTWSIYALALSRNGQYLASCSADLTTRIWDLTNPENTRCVVVLRGHDYYVTDVSFSPDDSILATSSLDGSIKLWDVQKSMEEYAVEGDHNAKGVQAGTILGHQSGVTGVTFSPLTNDDGSWLLASGSTDNTIRLWKVEPQHDIIQVAKFLNDNGTSDIKDIFNKQWKAITFRQISVLRGQPTWIVKMKFLPDGSRIVSMSWDGTVKFWLPYPVEAVPTLLGHGSSVMGVRFTPDGKSVLSVSGDNSARIWDVDRAVEICKMPTSFMNYSVATVRNDSGVLAAVGSEGGTIFMWDLTNPSKPIALPSLKDHIYTINTVTFNRDGTRLLSTGRDGTVQIWNVSQPTTKPVILKHPMSVAAAVFSPDERWIITGTGTKFQSQSLEGGTITVWDAVTHEREASFTEHDAGITSLAIKRSGDITWLVSTSNDKTSIVWDASDLPNLRVLHRLTGHTASVLSSAFHPTENRVATGSWDCTIKIWDLDTGAEMATLRGHIGAVTDLAFSPDGTRLASTSIGHDGKDNSIKLWETKWDPALAELRRQAKLESRRKKAAEKQTETK